MYALKYRIRTLSPVLISSFGDANMTRTMDYIPGHVLLGALASGYIHRKNVFGGAHRDQTFYNWFLQGGMIFSNAYLLVTSDKKEEFKLFPTPMSIQEDKAEECIYNLATLQEEVDEPTAPIRKYCYFKGGTMIVGTPEKQISFHHWRKERLKGNSSEGGIFNYEALMPGQVFTGVIYGEKAQLEEFKGLFGNHLSVRIGRSRNTQYGQAEVELGKVEKFQPDLNMENDDLEDDEVLLTFISPVVLVNQYGFPEVSQRVLKQYLEDVFGEQEFYIKEAFARVENIENHVSVWKLKKPMEKAFTIGTTFKIVFSEEIGEEIENRLYLLATLGLGERKNEGFGQVVVNWATRRTYRKQQKLKEATIEKPAGSPPSLIDTIFTSIITENITNYVINKAVNDAKEFSNLTGSLLGRLELMLKDSRHAAEFITKVNDLRKPARDKLKGCRNRNKKRSLWYILTNSNDLNWEKVLSSMENIRELEEVAGEIGFDFRKNRDFFEGMYKTYWQTFFRAMRKLNKEGVRAVE